MVQPSQHRAMECVSAALGCEGQGRASLWMAALRSEPCVEPPEGDTAPQKPRMPGSTLNGEGLTSFSPQGPICLPPSRPGVERCGPRMGCRVGAGIQGPLDSCSSPALVLGRMHSTPLGLSFHTCKMVTTVPRSLRGPVVRLRSGNDY